MRTPTPLKQQLAWWLDALTGFGRIHAQALEPQCGYFRCKLTGGGPFVPARIWLHQIIDEETGELLADEILRCEVNGVERNPVHAWPFLWNNCISQADYEFMEATRKWAEQHAQHEPAARPYERMSALTTPIPF